MMPICWCGTFSKWVVGFSPVLLLIAIVVFASKVARWRKVEKAKITEKDRKLFERYGEAAITNVLANNVAPLSNDLKILIAGPGKMNEAAEWLSERGAAHERREQRLETIEWAILIFVFASLIVDVLLLCRD
jgi:hypothetical protein